MPKFQYTALNQQNQSLNGIIDANNIETAKKQLSSLKLSLVDIQEIDTQILADNSFSKYKFQGLDKNQKVVRGTITSTNLLSAYQKLTQEYELTIEKIANFQASQEEFEASQQKIQQLQTTQDSLSEAKAKDTSLQEFQKTQKEALLLNTIEEILKLIQHLKAQYAEKLKPESLTFLEKYQQHLNKIKHSGNQENIIGTASKLLETLQNSADFLQLTTDLDALYNLNFQYNHLQTQLKKLKPNLEVSPLKKFFKQTASNATTSPFKNNLSILLKTQSGNLRIIAFKKVFNQIFSFFQNKLYSKTALQSTSSATEKEALTISFFLLIPFLLYYFLTVFSSHKFNKVQLSALFNIYETKLIIYIFLAIFLIHAALKIKMQIKNKTVYLLFLIMYILIVFNL